MFIVFCLDILDAKLYFVNGLKAMYEQLITKTSSIDFNGIIAKYADMLSAFINEYLSSVDNLKMASVILMITAGVMFLSLMIIVSIKSVFISSKNKQQNSSQDIEEDDDEDDDESDDIFDEEDAKELNRIIEEQERERELEKELQKELEMAQAERENTIQKKEQQTRIKEQKAKKQNEIENAKKESKNIKRSQKNSINLDWEKGKTPENEVTKPEILSYHQTNRQLDELLGLIIDMIGRGVDDLKIVQTIMFRNHYSSSEEDVLQLVDAIKDFIEICRKGSFNKLRDEVSLPSEEQALYHLSEGDPSLALVMLENLMDKDIDAAGKSITEAKKSALYNEISQQALIFGNLAAINDIHLATGSFELAIELEPHNIAAWSRLADMYTKTETTNKAIWAYQNVLDMADEEINPREVANAQKNLSQHLYAQGNSLQAAKLYNSSKQFYDSLGINRRLDKQEVEIVDIIEANHQNEVMFTIQQLLGKEANTGLSFS